ncbi:hypothetical protein Taro_050955 [Colocasia esculenta]|uniref:Uncharacterized protein n=1 Tax=Colocasia esculenta TaxID=4460 RepID=A0A843XFC8_COLES|nr:hypothetical protein [Colocasia esculenta]
MERHKPIPQPFFPSYNRTPKYLGCLNTFHPNPRDEFTTCWGGVEEFLVAGELWIDHKKDIFFPVRLLRLAQTVHLKWIKGNYDIQEVEQVEDGNASE